MAVYTAVSDEALSAFLHDYALGPVTSFKGIAEGVENSNFLIGTREGRFILTLYEKRVREADLPFFLGLMHHLADRGLTCPLPVARSDGALYGRLCERPAALVTFLDGIALSHPEARHCFALGEALARMHDAGRDFALQRPNALSLEGWPPLFAASEMRADTVLPGLAVLLAQELAFLQAHWPKGLPQGVIHADLFPDNVFFLDARVSGLIDFYFACTDALAYDVAICLNAWCFDAKGDYDIARGLALLDGYRRVRALDAQEREALPLLARAAALRFALTRLVDWLNVPPGALVRPKDPLEYVRKLRFHQSVGSAREYGLLA